VSEFEPSTWMSVDPSWWNDLSEGERDDVLKPSSRLWMLPGMWTGSAVQVSVTTRQRQPILLLACGSSSTVQRLRDNSYRESQHDLGPEKSGRGEDAAATDELSGVWAILSA
jgi:hypothetical protein